MFLINLEIYQNKLNFFFIKIKIHSLYGKKLLYVLKQGRIEKSLMLEGKKKSRNWRLVSKLEEMLG